MLPFGSPAGLFYFRPGNYNNATPYISLSSQMKIYLRYLPKPASCYNPQQPPEPFEPKGLPPSQFLLHKLRLGFRLGQYERINLHAVTILILVFRLDIGNVNRVRFLPYNANTVDVDTIKHYNRINPYLAAKSVRRGLESGNTARCDKQGKNGYL